MRIGVSVHFAAVIFAGLLLATLSMVETANAALPINEKTVGADAMKLLKGGCDEDPFPYLEQRKSGGAQITPRAGSAGSNNLQYGIDPGLACRLTKLFAAAEQRGCRVTIVSAYRAVQPCAPGPGCAPQGRSCHQYGRAVDVSSGCQGWLRQISPQFQLHFPYWGPHIQCLEHRVASCSPQTPRCNGGVNIQADPNAVAYYPGGGNQGGPPGDGALREAFFGPQPQPPQQPPPQQQPFPQQQPQIPPQPQLPPQPGNTQPGQYFNQPNPTDTNPSTIATPTSIASIIGGGGTSGSSSPSQPPISEQLFKIAYGTSSSGTATLTTGAIATSVPLVIKGKEVRQLQPATSTRQFESTTTVTEMSEEYQKPPHATSTLPQHGAIPLYPQQTFVSQDMSWHSTFSGTASQGAFLQILLKIRDALLQLLRTLRPGITGHIQSMPQDSESTLIE